MGHRLDMIRDMVIIFPIWWRHDIDMKTFFRVIGAL